MYQDIINFLLSRKKKMLSKEEAEKLIEMLAESIGIENEYKEKTDDQALIKNILEDCDLNDFFEESTVINALDDIFEYEENSIETSDTLESEVSEDDRPLIKRKITRGSFKSECKRIKDEKKGKLDLKKDSNVVVRETPISGTIKDEEKAIVKTTDAKDSLKSNNTSENKSIIEENKPKFNTDLFNSLKSEEKKFDSNLFFQLSDSKNNSNISELRYKGVDSTFPDKTVVNDASSSSINRSVKNFEGDSNVTNSKNIYEFDVGELKDVKNTGPKYKFYDQDGKEL